MDTKVIPVAVITTIVVLTLVLVSPHVVNPGYLPLKPTSFFSILLMFIFIPIGLIGILYINQVASAPLNDLFKNGSKSLLILLALIFCVFLLVTLVCMAVHPVDGFLDAGVMSGSTSGSGSGSDIDPLLVRLAPAESRACALMTRTDKFIEGAVGPKGMITNAEGDTEDTPEHQAYVKKAHVEARAMVPGGVLNCENPAAVTDTGARIALLNNTLRDFIGPNILSNYDSTINSKIACKKTPIPCYNVKKIKQEDILTNPTKYDEKTMLWGNEPNLDTAESAISCYESNILAPMDELTNRLKKGQLSECERKNAVS